ncbi:hypothetical protein RXV86_12975 [Alisedimentitalea sp. MJ-SS2]|uniref:hypothetical protein n=1 Tax=Aliisedimentitalea sp. MJ-SS2 TaxID=3049795 RepID=UPI00290F6FC7|nr:hypothetical protein [Alisedimentitalea sp. MJ-SS2]MDU8928302.1 hypothetical protein [Alisedimentitalea sp. MJ-SS2]
MSDMSWLSLEDAEAKFFATPKEILELVADGHIETMTVTGGDHKYLRVLEIHLDVHFKRRNPNTRKAATASTIAVGAASGVMASGIFEALKSLDKRTSNEADSPTTEGGSGGGDTAPPWSTGPGNGGEGSSECIEIDAKDNPPGGRGVGETGDHYGGFGEPDAGAGDSGGPFDPEDGEIHKQDK